MAGEVDELRHLEGLVGGIAVTDTEYMGTTALRENQLLTQVIYSNVKEIAIYRVLYIGHFWIFRSIWSWVFNKSILSFWVLK